MTAESATVRPGVLILASRFDFTCDYIVAALRRRDASYVRLNSEDLSDWTIRLDPTEPRCALNLGEIRYELAPDSLKAVVFRRPVYLRDYGDDRRSPEERFARFQWSAFLQNLEVFGRARWFNLPSSTYRAEHKALQLYAAKSLGMDVPRTLVTNDPARAVEGIGDDQYVVKGLDTVMIRDSGYETFGFTSVASQVELAGDAWRSAPTTVQSYVPNKVDIRATVVGDRVFACSIMENGHGVHDDWRLHKDSVEFVPHTLPQTIEDKCRALVQALGLEFGAIDLALSGGRYFFLEINPTGEWAWLVDAAGLKIDEAFADELSR